MSCVVVGPGLVGSYLGIAAEAAAWRPGPSGRPRADRARLPDGRLRSWSADGDGRGLPHLVCTRVPHTPWAQLPRLSLLAQNGMGQDRPCIACFMAVDRAADGTVGHVGPTPRLVVPPLAPAWRPVLSAWRACGIGVEEVADNRGARFEKLILNATVGPLCLATGLTMRAVWADAEWRTLVRGATAEGVAVARALAIPVATDLLARGDDFFARAGDHQPSVCTDPCELPWILGYLGARVHEAGLTCPAITRIAALVREVAV